MQPTTARTDLTPAFASYPVAWRLLALSVMDVSSPFSSFWQAGYEGADHITGDGRALDMNALTGHDHCTREDYLSLRAFGIHTVRESVGWRLSEQHGQFDFSRSVARAKIAQTCGVQVLWTLCHYGLPADVGLDDERFPARFARFCRAAVEALLPYQVGAPIFTLINEISFFAWALEETRLFGMPAQKAVTLKRQFVAATLAGMDEIRRLAPHARFLHVDPLIHIVPPPERPDLDDVVRCEAEAQYECWDMLAGRSCAELGGHDGALDLIGVNYYHSNQWEFGTQRRLYWHLDDRRRKPFAALLEDVWQRYRRPVVVSETSHVGAGRGDWLLDVAQQVAQARAHEVQLQGICLYPVVDRPDWNNERHWHKSGLWDVRPRTDRHPPGQRRQRILDMMYAADLRRAQKFLARRVPSLSPRTVDPKMEPLIVFSHLRWNFVFQRPQHLMVRLAEQQPVIFIEEPVYSTEGCFIVQSTPAPNVRVLTPHTTVATPGFDQAQTPVLQSLVRRFMNDHALTSSIAWLYTPMAVDLVDAARAHTVVFDCMDHLAGFKFAPPELAAKEAELLERADLVFTGGRSLFREKVKQHENVHCFPSSVDWGHFSTARDPRIESEAMKTLPRPRIGFFGVLDERLDIELVTGLADARPDWQMVFVGPVVKIDPELLPVRDNVHYLGQQSYDDLPAYLAAWDVCMMPFARNEATRFISPTKTLEYMAADLPVVSTPIVDVVEPYAGIVSIAASVSEFVVACDALLHESMLEKAARIAKMRRAVAATSWDRTVAEMRKLVAGVSRAKRAAAAKTGRPQVIALGAAPEARRSMRAPRASGATADAGASDS